ncbi:MAG: alpha/beta hydrolase [Methylobacterium frigidaeris]
MRRIGFTPPELAPDEGGPVRRRQVFYVPGYDPEANRRYRALFVREFGRYARRFDLPLHRVSPVVESPDGLSQSWTVEAGRAGWRTETAYEILLWDDLVRQDARRPLALSMLLLVAGLGHCLVTGKLFRLYGLNWKYGNVILYPFVLTLLLVLLAVGLGLGLAQILGDLAGAVFGELLLDVAATGLGLLGGVGTVLAATPLLDRIFLRQLINDWVFNWQHGNGWRPDYAARVDAMAGHVAARLDAGGADEVIIVGHSSGALAAVEVAARVLALRPAARLSVLTLGAGLPLVAINPRARRVRADIAALVASDRVVWAEYQAPQDWMNFPGFNPALDLGPPAGRVANPLIRSAQFRELIDPQAYPQVRRRPFRMHFQFLMANDRPGEYDIFALLFGPQSLRARVLAPEVVPLRRPAA